MATDGGIAFLIERLARLMRANEHSEGLNPAQWEAIRFLSRANRFSNSPGALTRYLGATKGTISQTILALVRKGYVTKAIRSEEKRSVQLALTGAGRDMLEKDPWQRLEEASKDLSDKTRRRMAKGAKSLISGELRRKGSPSFGDCTTCRYFREDGHENHPQGPHLCMHFNSPLTDSERTGICVAHEDAG